MELTPQALHDVEFREARRGGYNTRDVDDFLERVAIGVGQLQDRLREAYHRAEAAEARLGEMQRQLDEVQRRGPEGPSDADETLRRTLVLAQRTADATIKEAKDEAERLLTDARDEAGRIRASAESDARRDAKAEIEQLAASREDLLNDISALEQHIELQRSSLQADVEKLRELLDDPGTLRAKPAPSISEAPSFEPGAPSAPAEPAAPAFEPHGNGRASNGRADGSMVAALQELPRREPRDELPRREPMDPVAPTEPIAVPSAYDPTPGPSAFDQPSSSGFDQPSSGFDQPSPSFDPPSSSAFEQPSSSFDAPASSSSGSSTFEPPSFDPPPGGPTGFFPDLRAAFDPPRQDPPADNASLDDLPLPIDAPPPPPPPPGLEHLNDVGGIPIEPGSRPSEWGRGVFDTDDEGTPNRFGRR